MCCDQLGIDEKEVGVRDRTVPSVCHGAVGGVIVTLTMSSELIGFM